MLGGAQVVTLASAFVRTKIIALTLGPAGVGLAGVLTTFNGNVSALATWGLGTSGVRLISTAEGHERMGKQAAVRKMGTLLSVFGLLLSLVLVWPVTIMTFQDVGYAGEMLIAGLAVPCLIATTAWSSLLQADGHVKRLAYLQIGSAIVGVVMGAPLIYFYGSKGIASSMLLAAAIPALATWWIARKKCPLADVTAMPDDVKALIKLGGGLVFVGLASQVSAYVVRLIIIRHYDSLGGDGLAAAGYYQAAIAIAGSLPAAVFGAMGTDFFPRVAAAKSETDAHMLAEKQILAGLLLALPLLTALQTMGGVGLRMLYDDRFERAEPLLDWMIWGVFLRLIAWPLGYWLLARGSIRTVVVVETCSNLVMALLPLVMVPVYGAVGASYAYAIGFVCYTFVMLSVSRYRSGRWISLHVLGWYALAALWLGMSQFMFGDDSGWVGVGPTVIVTIGCVWQYIIKVRQESENE